MQKAAIQHMLKRLMRNTARLSNWSPISQNQAAVGHGFSSSYQRMVTKHATQRNFKKIGLFMESVTNLQVKFTGSKPLSPREKK